MINLEKLLKSGDDHGKDKEEVCKADKYPGNLLAELNKQRSDNAYCDVTLKVNYELFSCHRCVLASSSEYFKTMFTAEMKEKYQKTVELFSLSTEAFRRYLNFLYTAEIHLSTAVLTDVLEVANLTLTKDLMDVVSDYMIGVLEPENAFWFRDISLKYLLPEVGIKVDECLRSNFRDIVKMDGFSLLEESYLAQILAQDEIDVSDEEVIYEALLKWVECDISTRRAWFPSLFKHIRLQNISYDYISDNIRKQALVRESIGCRNLVEEAMDANFRPSKHELQPLRWAYLYCQEFTTLALLNSNGNNVSLVSMHNATNGKWGNLYLEKDRGLAGSAVVTLSDGFFFCGGVDPHNGIIHSDVANLVDNKWTDMSAMIAPRCGASAAYLFGRIFVFGGYQLTCGRRRKKPSGAAENAQDGGPNLVEMYNFWSETWTNVGAMKTPRYNMSLAMKGDFAYLLGGVKGSRLDTSNSGNDWHARYAYHGQPCTTVECFNAKQLSWTTCNDMNSPRQHFASAVHQNRLFVFGGLAPSNAQPQTQYLVEMMNIDNGTWTNIKAKVPPALRQNGTIYASAATLQKKICVAFSNINRLYIFDGNTGAWTEGQTHNISTGQQIMLLPWSPVVGVEVN